MKLTASFVIKVNPSILNAGEPISQPGERAPLSAAKRVSRRVHGSEERVFYISGQCWRRWLRDVIVQEKGWNATRYTTGEMYDDEDEGLAKVGVYGYSKCDPITYEDDDLFGYMRAEKDKTGGTVKRMSPLKSSVIRSISAPFYTRDFGTLSRLQGEGSSGSGIYNRELYACWMAGSFTIDLDNVGRFDVAKRNADLDPNIVRQHMSKLNVEMISVKHDQLVLVAEERARRVRDLLTSFPLLEGGGNLTRNLTDVTPQAVIAVFTDRGNAILDECFIVDSEAGDIVQLDIARLDALYAEGRFKELHYAAYPGVIKDEPVDAEGNPIRPYIVRHNTIMEMMQALANEAEKYYNSIQIEPRFKTQQALEESLQKIEKKNSNNKQKKEDGSSGKRGSSKNKTDEPEEAES